MNKKYPIAVMSKAAALTLVASLMGASTAYAAKGDYYDTNSKKIYKSIDLSNKENLNELFKSYARQHNKIIFQFKDNVYLDYGKTNDAVKSGKTVFEAVKDENNMIKPGDFNNFKEYIEVSEKEENNKISVESISAINGKLTVTMNKDIKEVPSNLVVMKDGKVLKVETKDIKLVEGKVEITVPKIEASTKDVTKVMYSIKLGEDKEVEKTIIIPAKISPAKIQLKVESVNAINGKLTVTMNKDIKEVPSNLVVMKDGKVLKVETKDIKLVEGKVEITVPKIEASKEKVTEVKYRVQIGESTAVEGKLVLPIQISDLIPATKIVGVAEVEAYEKAPMTTLDEIAKVKELRKIAESQVAKLTAKEYKDVKASLEARIKIVNEKVVLAEKELNKVKVELVTAITRTEVTVVLVEKPASELVADKFDITVNDGEVFNPTKVEEVAADATGKTFKLKLKDSLNDTQGVLKVNGIAKSNLENTSVNFDFKKPEMVKAEVLDERHVKVTFSEEMSTEVEKIANVGITKITDDNDVLSKGVETNAIDGFGVLSTDKKSVIYTLASDKNLVPAKYVVKAKLAKLVDLSGDATNVVVKDSEIYFQANGDSLKDVTAPKVTEASYDSSTKQLKLTFDEAIKGDSYAATGVTFGSANLTTADAATIVTNVVTITLSNDTVAKLDLTGDANVVLKDAFTDAAGNKVNGTLKTTLQTPPELATADAKDSSFDETTRVLTIKFNEPVKVANVAAITLAGTPMTADDKVVKETDGTDTIRIQLSKATYDKIKNNAGKTSELTIVQKAVKDLDGTANKDINKVEVAYIQDEKAPVVKEATFNNRTHELEIKFNESIKNPVEGNVKLASGAETKSLADLKDGNIDLTDNIVKLKIKDGAESIDKVKTWFDTGKVSIITTAEGDIEDYAGNKVAIIANDEKAPVVTLIDQIAPEVNEKKLTQVLSKTKLQVEFNEIMDKASVEVAKNFKVYDLQNDKNIVATSAVLDEDGKTVILTFGEELNIPNQNNYKVIVNNVRDKAGNRIANDTEWHAFSMEEGDKKAPTVSDAKFTNKETNSIVVTFSKKVNVEEAANLANYELIKANKDYDLTNAKIVTSTVANSTVVTITFDNVIPSQIDGLTLKAKDIHDIAGNKITETPVKVEPDVEEVDAVLPTYVATLLDGSNEQNDKIKISFNKPVSAEEATKKENYTITEPKDTEVAPKAIQGLAIKSISNYDKELNQVVITLNKSNVGSLKLAVGENKILDITGHAVAKDAKELKVIDLSALSIKEAKAEAKFANKKDEVSVEFDKKVYTDNVGTELIQAKVKDALVVKVGDTILTGDGNDGWILLGNKATLTIDNKELKKGDTVTISLKDGQKLYDKTGNVLESLNQKVKVVAESEEFNAPEPVNYKKEKNTVELEFDHEIDPNSVKADGTDFVVKGYTVQSATVDASQKKVTIKIAEKLSAEEHIIRLAKDSCLCDAVGNKLVADELGKVKGEADIVVPADKTAPILQGNPTIDKNKKIVTLTFNEGIVNGTINEDSLKAAVTFSSDGNKFNSLGNNDTVEISGSTLKVTFENAISGSTNKIKIANKALKDTLGNETEEIITNAIDVK